MFLNFADGLHLIDGGSHGLLEVGHIEIALAVDIVINFLFNALVLKGEQGLMGADIDEKFPDLVRVFEIDHVLIFALADLALDVEVGHELLQGLGMVLIGGSNNIGLMVGRFNNQSPTCFDGIIDNFRIYNYARSASEILVDYNSGLAAHLR